MGKALWVLGLETQCITIPHYRKAHKHLALAETGCPAVKTDFFLFFASLILLGGRRKRMSQHPIPTSTMYTDITTQDAAGLPSSLNPFTCFSDARGEQKQNHISEQFSAWLQIPANDPAAFRAFTGEY